MKKGYLLHDFAGALIAFVVLLIFTINGKGDPYNIGIGIAAFFVFLIGAGKELVWDKLLKRGTPEWYDLFCTLRGGWIMIFVYKFLEKLIS